MDKQLLIEVEYMFCIEYMEGLIFGNPANDSTIRACASHRISEMKKRITDIKQSEMEENDGR